MWLPPREASADLDEDEQQELNRINKQIKILIRRIESIHEKIDRENRQKLQQQQRQTKARDKAPTRGRDNQNKLVVHVEFHQDRRS